MGTLDRPEKEADPSRNPPPGREAQMAKEQEPRVVEVKIDGEPLKRGVKNFSPPESQRPWWVIYLEDGNRIYATGDISVEIRMGAVTNSEYMKGILDLSK
jgi:hypothetical protein